MSEFSLPSGAYLGWRYIDAASAIDRHQLYFADGRVELTENGKTQQLCVFDDDQVQAAKSAIESSGLIEAKASPTRRVADAATVIYAWRVNGRRGSVANHSYPAVELPEVKKLDDALADIEEAAGCWPLMADEDN